MLRFGSAHRKAGSTLRSSRAVPHPSTNRALRRLTSEVGRDPVHSTRYGRQRQRCSVRSVVLSWWVCGLAARAVTSLRVACCFWRLRASCVFGAARLMMVSRSLVGWVLVCWHACVYLCWRGRALPVQHCICTVAILAQGTSWAVAVTQAFLDALGVLVMSLRSFCCRLRFGVAGRSVRSRCVP